MTLAKNAIAFGTFPSEGTLVHIFVGNEAWPKLPRITCSTLGQKYDLFQLCPVLFFRPSSVALFFVFLFGLLW